MAISSALYSQRRVNETHSYYHREPRRARWGGRRRAGRAAARRRRTDAEARGRTAVAKAVPGGEALGPRIGHRRRRRRPGPHLGRPPRRRLAAEQREGSDARTVGELLL